MDTLNQNNDQSDFNVRVDALVSPQFVLVDCGKEFKFRKLCPYCEGNLTYKATEWEKQDDGTWVATSFDSECSSEPDIESDEWEEWMNIHSDMPYVNQLPVDMAVKEYIEKKYRFKLSG